MVDMLRTLTRRSSVVLAIGAALALAACTTTATSAPGGVVPRAAAMPAPDRAAPAVTTRVLTDGVLTDTYLPGLDATLRVPATAGPAPLVVMVPGGGWATSDPTDYVPLAQSLQSAGISTSLITYSTTSSGAQLPRPLDDVACAVRWSAFQLGQLGYPPSRVVIAGHSAGGQLAMEVALTGNRFGADCPMPSAQVDGVIGMAGVYDLSDATVVPAALFPDGGSADQRAQYSPLTALSDRSAAPGSLGVLLMQGDSDSIVPAAQQSAMADALRARGMQPVVDVLPGLEHNMGFPLATEIAPIIKFWVLGDTAAPVNPEDLGPQLPTDSVVPGPGPADSAGPTPGTS